MAWNCAVCGKPTKQKTKKYCSKKCYMEKGPAVIWLEKEHKKDIKTILCEAFERYKKQNLVAGFLGVSEYAISQWTLKFKIWG